MKLISRVGGSTGRILILAALTTVLTACGGGSGDSIGDQDFDEDGIINSEDEDADGDNVLDADDPFVDLNGDGLDDSTLLTEEEAIAALTPPVEGDLDGDGFVDVTAEAPCGGESGSVNDGSSAVWNDNCEVRRFGQFARSLYAVGVQRVVYCAGYGAGSTYTEFADGQFGEGSDLALKEFQLSGDDVQTDDGRVGPRTWAKLQAQLEELDPGEFVANPDGTTTAQSTYGFSEGRCAGIALFYQETSPAEVITDGVVRGGWTMARNQPNQAVAIPLSIEAAAGRL